MAYKALGCHVFAGGFTMGVRDVFHVPAQFEIHGLGRDTVRSMGIEFIENKYWEEWLQLRDLLSGCSFLFGNPRCTGFSCVTAGYDETAHGAWSKPTEDIHQLCHLAVKADIPVICWESVQQAWSVGKELLDHLRDNIFGPAGYRVLHLFINAASFGNPQHRKRYFFVAYKADKKFNIVPPTIPSRHTTVGDVLLTPELLEREVSSVRLRKGVGYTPDMYIHKGPADWDIIPHIPRGWDLNVIGHRRVKLFDHSPRLLEQWETRTSEMPFSMHCLARLHEDGFCPVISGSAGRFIHPTLDRPVTIRELARLMGWPDNITPIGDNPVGQIGKGIVPAIGTWIAEQVKLYLDDAWGSEDWESTYNDKTGRWEGRDFTGHAIPPVEKVIDMTTYCPPKPEYDKEPY